MADIFFVSDTHFSHKNILNFQVHTPDCERDTALIPKEVLDGPCDCPRMRPLWRTVEEMDDYMVEQWNKTVKASDKIYHLGDVAMNRDAIKVVGRCHGHKRLVRGNHDIFPTKYYLPFFEDIYAVRVMEDMLFSHIPIHPESLRENWTNVHGHVHNNVPALHFGSRYLNISVEVTDYRPLSIEEVRQRVRLQKQENQRLIHENLKRIGITPWDEGLEEL